MKNNFKYIYGPVPSWRLGGSLGVDLLSQEEKICSFDCVYCQLGRTKKYSVKRKSYISAKDIIDELIKIPQAGIDYITFSGRGEPTLAENIGRTIRAVKDVRKEKIAVITNSSLLTVKYVRDDLLAADFVIAKLDVCCQDDFERINRPASGTNFGKVIAAIKNFRQIYKGRLALQIMFIQENKQTAAKIAEIARLINPDEVQINTPLRTCEINPLSYGEIEKIEVFFKDFNITNVYKALRKEVAAISDADTLKRRGK